MHCWQAMVGQISGKQGVDLQPRLVHHPRKAMGKEMLFERCSTQWWQAMGEGNFLKAVRPFNPCTGARQRGSNNLETD